MTSLISHLREFARREDGTIMVEGIVVLPLLLVGAVRHVRVLGCASVDQYGSKSVITPWPT